MAESPENEGTGEPPSPQPFITSGQGPEAFPAAPATPPGWASPGQPGYGGASPGQPGYGVPPQGQPGYGGASPGQPGYGVPPQGGPPAYGSYQPYPVTGAATYQRGKDPALAEWWQRLLARMIDAIVVGILASPFWISAIVSMVHSIQDVMNRYPDSTSPQAQAALNNVSSQMTSRILLIVLVSAAITFGYDWLQHGLWGQTLGKRAFGTKVVREDDRGQISGSMAAARAAVYGLAPVLPLVGSFFALLNELWLLWDPRRQCLHDKAAKTIVVKKSSLATPPGAPGLQPNSSV